MKQVEDLEDLEDLDSLDSLEDLEDLEDHEDHEVMEDMEVHGGIWDFIVTPYIPPYGEIVIVDIEQIRHKYIYYLTQIVDVSIFI